MLTKAYQLAKDPPPAMEWREYETQSLLEWRRLLDSPEASDEGAVHRFLERNPSFVPGAFSFPQSGHYPLYCGVFSIPLIRGLGTYIPDFLWLATASDLIFPVFVEIEVPTKHWFTKSGQPTAEFTQARSQLVDWAAWMRKPENELVFRSHFGISGAYARYEIRPQYLLIYGRRKEFESRPELLPKRTRNQGWDEHHITFDRLNPDYKAKDLMTVRMRNSRVEAMVVPPTLELSPALALSWSEVRGRSEAALSETRMTESRRAFVAERIAYWDRWAEGSSHFFCGSDYE